MMKLYAKLALAGALVSGLVSVAMAGSLGFSSGGGSMNSTWTVNIPAGASVRTLVTATVGSVSNPAWYWGGTLPGSEWTTWVITETEGVLTVHIRQPFNYYGSSPSNPSPSYASAIAGIAGPPAGLLHEARVTLIDVGAWGYDEKWSYNLVGGQYTIYHGGGVSGNGAVTAYTEVTW